MVTTIPEIGVIDLYGYGLRRIRGQFWVLLGAVVVFVLFGGIAPAVHEGDPSGFSAIATAYQFLVMGPVTFGLYYLFLNAARDNGPEIGDILQGFRDYVNVVIANVVMTFVIGFGFLLLIVPGVILACRLILMPYLVMDRKMPALEAFRESWRLTRGHGWTVFFMMLLAVPIIVAGLFVFGFGVLFSIIWIGLSFAALYVAICDDANSDPYGPSAIAA
jgi:uncharacterized membrane protein